MENLNRILPKGSILPVPLLGGVTIGSPIRLDVDEEKSDFLARARARRAGPAIQLADENYCAPAGPARRARAAWSPADEAARWLIEGVLALLVVASVIGWILSRRVTAKAAARPSRTVNVRIRAWWFMAAIFGVALFIVVSATTVLFGIVSFLALGASSSR